jgi:vesicle-associated membrane protein 7
MSQLIYGLVSRGENVLAEYTTSKGNFSTITRRLLQKIPAEDGTLSYIYDDFVFNYCVSGGLIFLCMTTKQFRRVHAFKFLSELEDRFLDTYGDRGQSAVAYAFNADFKRVIQKLMEEFNATERSSDRISQVQSQLDSIKDVMICNIDTVLERGDKIDILVERSELMEQNAFKFGKGATKLRRHYRWKNVKLYVLLTLFILVIIYACLAIACGLDLQSC